MARRPLPAPILLIAVIVSLLTMVPTIQGWATSDPPEMTFLGFRHMPQDHYQYASFMRQAREDGRFFMENLYTGEPQRGSYVMLFYWFVGNFARLTGLALTEAWEIFRVTGTFLYILVFWFFLRSFLPEEGKRVFATLVFAAGGGLMWLVTLLRMSGIRFLTMLEEPFGFHWNWSAFGSTVVPTWIWAALVMTFVLHLFLARPRGWQVLNFVLLPILWLMHHHTAAVAYLTFGLIPVTPVVVSLMRLESVDWVRVRGNLRDVLPALASFLVVLVYLVWARQDEVLRLNAARSFEWDTFFAPWWYPITYGLLLPLAFFGIREVSRDESQGTDVLLAWLSGAFLLASNPVVAGAKFQFLLWPPLVILAVIGLDMIRAEAPRFDRLARKPLVVGLFLFILFMDVPMTFIKNNGRQLDQAGYFPQADIDAMTWLDDQPEGLVLSEFRSGHLIPWLSGQKVYVGHWFMTIDLRDKRKEAAYFFSPQTPLAMRTDILRRSQARYVYHGAVESMYGELDPRLPLQRIYEQDGVSIYEVVR